MTRLVDEVEVALIVRPIRARRLMLTPDAAYAWPER